VTVAVIPARGGSQRIPRKNIRPFCGKPMIAWTIAAALESKLFDRVLVSTDDAEIAATAEQWGAECPFVRPASLADHHTGMTEVVAHATKWAVDAGWPAGEVCCLHAAAPFIAVEDLRRGLDALRSGGWAFTIAAAALPSVVYRAFRQRDDGALEMLFPQFFTTRSQDLPGALHDAAQFYWGRADAWLGGRRLFGDSTFPIVVSSDRVQDIDEMDDWTRAEEMFTRLRARTI
jgi:pseudaminic acid cytidylyltransferase